MTTESQADTTETKKQLTYCPTCESRYTYSTSECRYCGTPLVSHDPRPLSFFDPVIDLPLAVLTLLFFYGYQSLPGEARSFGIIFLIIACFCLVVSRVLRYFEWKGRQ